MMDRTYLLSFSLLLFDVLTGVQAAPYPKSLARARRSKAASEPSHIKVDLKHSTSASARIASEPGHSTSTRHAASQSTSSQSKKTMLSGTRKSSVGRPHSVETDKHSLSPSPSPSSTVHSIAISTSQTLRSQYHPSSVNQHIVGATSASRSSTQETRAISAATQSSSGARSTLVSHPVVAASSHSSAKSGLLSASSHPPAHVSPSSDVTSSWATATQFISSTTSLTRTQNGLPPPSRSTEIAVKSMVSTPAGTAQIEVPATEPPVRAATLSRSMQPAETMAFTLMDPPLPHTMQPFTTVMIEASSCWNPISTMSEDSNGRQADVYSSSMIHDSGLETQYYAPPDSDDMMATSDVAFMTESTGTSSSSMDDSFPTTAYGIRIGASGAATLSTTVLTTFAYSTITSASHTFTSSYPVTSTTVTLVPIPIPTTSGTAPVSASSNKSPPRNTALVVGLAVSLSILLIAAVVAVVFWSRRRQQQQQRPQILADEPSFFPEPFVSPRSSVRTASVYSQPSTSNTELEAEEELELAGPPLQASEESSFLAAGVSLRGALAAGLRPSTVQGEYHLPSRRASIVDPSPQSPASSSGSSAARQEQLTSEVSIVLEEISALQTQTHTSAEEGDGIVVRRIAELYARMRDLEREQEALRLELEGDYPPPEYVSTEG